ncbi:hypothetical protein J6X13_02800 [Candidatus Saccharibacteria bacterium]|nr:hypothetical protein [Candidatus Saccharibacteria bacterium]
MQNSARNVTVEMMNLSEESKALLEGIPLLDVIMMARQHRMAPDRTPWQAGNLFYKKFRTVKGWNRSDAHSLRHDIVRLGREVNDYLKSENLIKSETDFSDNQRFVISSKIWALRHCARTCHPILHSDNKYSYWHLVVELDCDQYESWEGYSDQKLKEIDEFLISHLSPYNYKLLSYRYSLKDGKFVRRKDVAEKFGFNCETTAANYEGRALEELHESLDEFLALTEIA